MTHGAQSHIVLSVCMLWCAVGKGTQGAATVSTDLYVLICYSYVLCISQTGMLNFGDDIAKSYLIFTW